MRMEDLPITPYLTIPGTELQVAFARSSGPGGQNVNKVNSKVSLSWNLEATSVLYPTTLARLRALAAHRITDDGILRITCQTHREQSRNMAACRERLRQIVLEALEPVVPRKPTRPTAGARRRRLDNKRQTSEKKRGRSSQWDS